MHTLSPSNWNFCSYNSSTIKAFISIGGTPEGEENDQLCYFVNSTSEDFTKQYFQQEFKTIDKALEFINKRYGHWDFVDASIQKDSESGCGSCEAH